MKMGGTEIEVLLTFERNSFTESKNHDFFTFQFKTEETADAFCNYHHSLYKVLSKTLNIAMANYYSEIYCLRS